jgi:hypothetical protein
VCSFLLTKVPCIISDWLSVCTVHMINNELQTLAYTCHNALTVTSVRAHILIGVVYSVLLYLGVIASNIPGSHQVRSKSGRSLVMMVGRLLLLQWAQFPDERSVAGLTLF